MIFFFNIFFLQKLVLCEGLWLTPLGCGDVNSLEQLLFSVERNRGFLKSGGCFTTEFKLLWFGAVKQNLLR